MRRVILLIAMLIEAAFAQAQTNELHYYTKLGDYENVAHFINRHEDVNAFDDNGYTPLMYAADMGRNDIVKLLMDNGAEPNYLTLWDNEPPALHAAVLSNYPGTVELLLQYPNTKVDLRDSSGYTPLYHAVRHGYIDCARVLLAHRANVDIACNGRITALMEAVKDNDTAMTRLLLTYGAHVDRDAMGRTPFSVAVEHGALDAARMLREAGADIVTASPVHYAAMYADTAMLEYLYSLWRNFNDKSSVGYSPRDLAVIAGRNDNCDYIKRMGGKFGKCLLFKEFSASITNEFFKREYRLGLQAGIHELRYNWALYLGGSLRPAYKPVLIQYGDHAYYQLREKRRMLHFTVEKRFQLSRNQFPGYGLYLMYQYATTSANYDGAIDLDPEGESFHVPGVGFYSRFRNIGLEAGWRHYGYRHHLEPPKDVINLTLSIYWGRRVDGLRPMK